MPGRWEKSLSRCFIVESLRRAVTRSGGSVGYMPAATKARSPLGPPGRASPNLLVAAHLILPWCAGVRPRIIMGFPSNKPCGRIQRAKTRLTQTSWVRSRRVGSCDVLTCPSAGRVEQDVRRTWGDFWDISGFLQLKCLIILTASKAKSWMVTGTGNMSIVMLSK